MKKYHGYKTIKALSTLIIMLALHPENANSETIRTIFIIYEKNNLIKKLCDTPICNIQIPYNDSYINMEATTKTDSEIIKFTNGETLYATTPSGKTFIEIPKEELSKPKLIKIYQRHTSLNNKENYIFNDLAVRTNTNIITSIIVKIK